MCGHAGVSKHEGDDHFAERIFKIGQLLTELFSILCAEKSFEKKAFFCEHL